MAEQEERIKSAVIHWKKKLERIDDEEVMLNILRKVAKLPISWDLLMETKIGRCLDKLSSRQDVIGEKCIAILDKWRIYLARIPYNCKNDKKNVCAKENVIEGSYSKSSSGIDSHEEKKIKQHYQESSNKESKVSTHHKSSNSHISKNHVTDNSPKDNSTLHTYQRKEDSPKCISYDPHLDVNEDYNPESPDLFSGSKSTQKECDSYEPSVKRKFEIQTETVSETKSKKIKSASKSDQISVKKDTSKSDQISVKKDTSKSDQNSVKKDFSKHEQISVKREVSKPGQISVKKDVSKSDHTSVKKSISKSDQISVKKEVSKSDQNMGKKDKHKKHEIGESRSRPEKVQSLNIKKDDCDVNLDNYSKKKSPEKTRSSKSIVSESDKNKEKSSKKSKTKLKFNSTVEFTSSEANFEDCLGLNDIVIKKKKSSKSSQNASKTDNKVKPKVEPEKTQNKKHSSSDSSHQVTSKQSSSVQKEKSHISVPKPEKIPKIQEVDIMSTLPQTLPNYRPLPRVETLHPKRKEVLTNEDAILYMSSKREKTAVYSGRRNCYYYAEVPTLFDVSTRCLIEHIDYIECLGNTPYSLIKQVLEKCTPQQLLQIENYNPHLVEDTDELWEIHCRRDCKLLQLEENETYRELYLRAQDERERKLKRLTANISASMSKYSPARQVKLAYVNSVAKPPRDVARKQAKNGTALPVSHPVKAGPPSKATPRAVAPVINASRISPVPVPNHVIKTKPKVAPLMAKTLKSMKLCFRR